MNTFKISVLITLFPLLGFGCVVGDIDDVPEYQERVDEYYECRQEVRQISSNLEDANEQIENAMSAAGGTYEEMNDALESIYPVE